MARNNHQESETARAGVREATDRAEDVMQTGIQAARRVAEEFGRVLGVGGQNENLTQQASQNLEAHRNGLGPDPRFPGRVEGMARTDAGAAPQERGRDEEARAMPHVAGLRRRSERLGSGQPEPDHRPHSARSGKVDAGC